MKNFNAPAYLKLTPSGTPARMRALLAIVHKENAPSSRRLPEFRAQNWRAARSYGFGNWASAYCELTQGGGDKNPLWYAHTGEQFRGEKYADEVGDAYIQHEGWYSDMECSEKYRGIVGLLTHGRFIAGYTWTANGERVYFDRVFSDESDAARFADSEAESIAEDARADAGVL